VEHRARLADPRAALTNLVIQGDSGGPMSVQRSDGRFMLSGVISWGIGCAEKNQPGVYTRISEFRDWVNQILQY
jgi:secreted trypsin-like serine protease